jgi:hypothetical protein
MYVFYILNTKKKLSHCWLKVTDEATGAINPGLQLGGRKLSNILQIHKGIEKYN